MYNTLYEMWTVCCNAEHLNILLVDCCNNYDEGAILTVLRQIENPTLSVDAYKFTWRTILPISFIRSTSKRRFFEQGRPPPKKKQKEQEDDKQRLSSDMIMRSVPIKQNV